VNSAPIYQSWRTGKNGFGPYHKLYPPSQWTVCGKIPDGIVTTRLKPPPDGECCKTCELRDSLRVRQPLEPSHPFGRNR